jgi:hypothetical protein
VAGALAALLSVSILVTPAASADHSNDGGAGDPDNGDHYMDRNSLSSVGDTASVWGRDELNRARDMNATFTGSGDVEIYDYTYGDTDWHGITDCPDGINWINGNCDVFRVRFNQSSMAGHSLDHWRSLGCHELGHTAGLGHRKDSNDTYDNSCMREEIWPRSFDSHDLDAINSAV